MKKKDYDLTIRTLESQVEAYKAADRVSLEEARLWKERFEKLRGAILYLLSLLGVK